MLVDIVYTQYCSFEKFIRIPVSFDSVLFFAVLMKIDFDYYDSADTEKAVCAVTGLPAKYRDPKTGLPYATKEAFKIIRQELSDKTTCISEKKSVGFLFDALPGQGFPEKRKRTMVPKKGMSYFRPFARFRRFPPIEMEDSE